MLTLSTGVGKITFRMKLGMKQEPEQYYYIIPRPLLCKLSLIFQLLLQLLVQRIRLPFLGTRSGVTNQSIGLTEPTTTPLGEGKRASFSSVKAG